MRRRDFIATLAAMTVGPIGAARAQTADRVKVLGVLFPGSASDPLASAYVNAFRQGLAASGWIEGRNLRTEIRYGGGDAEKIASDARDLAAPAPDAIFTFGNPALTAVLTVTRTIPTIFAGVGDPVAAGFVPNLSHPGGNTTGFGLYAPSIAGKWLEFLKEAAPQVTTVTMLMNAATPSHAIYRANAETAAGALSIALIATDINSADDIAHAIDGVTADGHAGLLVLPSNVAVEHRNLLIARAAARRIPAAYPFTFFARSGGLIGYSPDLDDQCRRAAAYVDRVFRGEKPGDLPVQNPTKFERVINLKTAAALGLTLPPTLLAQADDVIE
ncbi:MAG TPA: ABC transporter substrate-binding protein [Stellaceae bacterium]|nr:ABC transporter substrate-binding protein [Stellaceae bacterium]